jgi:hypothetical protein
MIFTGGNRGNRVLWERHVVHFDEILELVETAVVWRLGAPLSPLPLVPQFVSIRVHSWLNNPESKPDSFSIPYYKKRPVL